MLSASRGALFFSPPAGPHRSKDWHTKAAGDFSTEAQANANAEADPAVLSAGHSARQGTLSQRNGIRVRVRDLQKRYLVIHDRPFGLKDAVVRRLKGITSKREEFWALRGVSFEVRAGEALGIIGPNGSGKSTLLGLIGRVLRPTAGIIETYGRISILMEAGVGFHEDLTGLENIYLSGALLGMSRREISQKLERIIEFAEIAEFIDTPVRMLSSGMYMRLGFSVAIHLDPDILLVDEVLAVGDEAFRQKCHQRLAEFREQGGAILFVSHRMPEIQALCNRVIWLEAGQIRLEGPTEDVVAAYLAAQTPTSTECSHNP